MELKLKLCRGYSTRKILVREAKLCYASKVVVGISKSYHTIHSSISVAKYLARKLSKDCWVLAVDNGKIMFQKDGSPSIIQKGLAFFSFFEFLSFVCDDLCV